MTYTLHYTSADGPGDDATWSVYSEQYENIESPEPIEGSTKHVGTYASEIEADNAANAKQRGSYSLTRQTC